MNRRLTSALAIAAIASGAGAAQAQAALFTRGNVVVYRVGDGSAALSSAGTPVFLDEYSPAAPPGSNPVQSLALPTSVSGANKRLIASGVATSEGLLTRSTNGRFLVATGYDAAVGTASIASTASASMPRVVGLVDRSAATDTTTALDAYTGNNIRGATSTDGTDIWTTGNSTTSTSGGVRYTTRGATMSTQLSTTVTNLRNVNIFGGQLFVSSGSGSVRVGTVGSGTPTTSGQTITNLPGIPTTTGSPPVATSPYQFVLLDLDPAVGFTPAGGSNTGLDTLYVADDAPGTIQKYRYDGTNFVAAGTATFAGARGLTGYVTDGNVTLFVTTGGSLATLTDTAAATTPSTFSGTPTTIATAATNTAFRGVAFAPVAATAASWRGGKALARGKGVLVTWKTGREADNLGFDVLRARKGSARRVKVTRKLITGSALSGAGGTSGSYRFRDRDGKPGDKYFVVSRATDGTKEVHGPLVARSSTGKASR